jgi:hypothetical protein
VVITRDALIRTFSYLFLDRGVFDVDYDGMIDTMLVLLNWKMMDDNLGGFSHTRRVCLILHT